MSGNARRRPSQCYDNLRVPLSACGPLSSTVALTFKSLEVSEFRVRSEPDDYALSALTLDLVYSTGRVERDIVVQVWHALGPLSGGTVRLITAVAHRDPICQPHIARSIEHFYRQRFSAAVESLRFSARPPGDVGKPARPSTRCSTEDLTTVVPVG